MFERMKKRANLRLQLSPPQLCSSCPGKITKDKRNSRVRAFRPTAVMASSVTSEGTCPDRIKGKSHAPPLPTSDSPYPPVRAFKRSEVSSLPHPVMFLGLSVTVPHPGPRGAGRVGSGSGSPGRGGAPPAAAPRSGERGAAARRHRTPPSLPTPPSLSADKENFSGHPIQTNTFAVFTEEPS